MLGVHQWRQWWMFIVHQISMHSIQVVLGGIEPTQNLLYIFQWWNQEMDGVFLEVEGCFLTWPSWVGRGGVLNWPFVSMFIIRQGWGVRGMWINKGFYSCFRVRDQCAPHQASMSETLPNLGNIFYLSSVGLKYVHCRINYKYLCKIIYMNKLS